MRATFSCHACFRSENEVEDEEDLYDCVYDDEDGGDIYEDLMKTEALPPPVSCSLPFAGCCNRSWFLCV